MLLEKYSGDLPSFLVVKFSLAHGLYGDIAFQRFKGDTECRLAAKEVVLVLGEFVNTFQ